MLSKTTVITERVFKRKIYIYALCEGLIFWYAIEKLFQQSLGFSLATIVTIGIVAQAGTILFEIPSSILADKWHRRNSLVLASAVMLVVTIGLTFISTPLAYAGFALLWALYEAFKSGTDTAFIYDSLKSIGAQDQFQKVLARYGNVKYAALIASSFVVGFIITATNLRVPFWLTTIPIIVGGLIMWSLPEPAIGRETDTKFWAHASEAWQEIKHKKLLWVMTLYALLFAMQSLWYEFYGLYGLAVNAPEVLFGTILSILCIGLIVGGELVHRFSINKKTVAGLWVVLGGLHLAGPWIHSFVSFGTALFIIMICMNALYLGLTEVVNENIASKRRATILSLAGGVAQLMFIGMAIIFQYFVANASVQIAFAIASLPMIALGIIDICRRVPWLQRNAGLVVDATNDIVRPR